MSNNVSKKTDHNIINLLDSVFDNKFTKDIVEQEDFAKICELFELAESNEQGYYPISEFVFKRGFEKTIAQVNQFGSKEEMEKANCEIAKLEASIKLSQKNLKEQQDAIVDSEKRLKKLNVSQKNIYTSFITILGLFSSLV
ncbi:hypothetical protein [Xylocopilactobacillus apicola]|uniref:Uncharacterized protein n=1 Tax=Xylocopilactobacillus apicola TaxID=2932184 RepID=A0AAU9DLF3_9LACO|nr:hypothetical protein [Xylocopilactobacillus apicola]BDR59401.1 hypothetical protein XA3_18420 [Xylocopilactobacillus apicola]